MRYAYHEQSSKQFEELVILLCQELFGMGVTGFADGKDGGRDARFTGRAQAYPSATDPWDGCVIVQAKVTHGMNAAFSDSDFFSETGSTNTIAKEIPRIKALKASEELDYYFLVSNRRLTAATDKKLRAHLSEQCQIEANRIALVDVEQIERWLKAYPKVHERAELDPFDSPLIVRSDDLAEVVAALADHNSTVTDAISHPPTERTSYKDKNELNNMSPDYAATMRRSYLKHTGEIQDFLAAPQNAELQLRYEETVEEFQAKIIAKQMDFHTFDNVMEHLRDILFDRDSILRQHRRLTKALLFFMYWNCDIGKSLTDA